MSRQNQWFVPGDGIAREVITADIQRYLGPDALVRPGPGSGEYEGRSGYWITAYRTLTSQMIQDLIQDSTRWQQEQQGRQDAGRGGSPYMRETKVSRHPDSSLVAYQDSRTHAARQHWGPTESYSSGGGGGRGEPARASGGQQYPTSEHYTTAPSQPYGSTPNPSYGSSHSQGYQPTQPAYGSRAAAPRTNPDPYAGYSQPGREHASYATPQQYAGYSPSAPQDPYRTNAPPPTHPYGTAPSPVPAPGYYIASDGRQYPLSAQQPQQSRGSRGTGRPA